MKRWTLFLTMGGFLLFLTIGSFFLFASPPASRAAGDAGKGKVSYEKLCAPCHGNSGKGDGPAAAQLPVRPRDHTDKKYMDHLTDQHIFEVVKNGGASVQKSPLMPPFGMTLKDDQIWDVVAYVRTLSRKK